MAAGKDENENFTYIVNIIEKVETKKAKEPNYKTLAELLLQPNLEMPKENGRKISPKLVFLNNRHRISRDGYNCASVHVIVTDTSTPEELKNIGLGIEDINKNVKNPLIILVDKNNNLNEKAKTFIMKKGCTYLFKEDSTLQEISNTIFQQIHAIEQLQTKNALKEKKEDKSENNRQPPTEASNKWTDTRKRSKSEQGTSGTKPRKFEAFLGEQRRNHSKSLPGGIG